MHTHRAEEPIYGDRTSFINYVGVLVLAAFLLLSSFALFSNGSAMAALFLTGFAAFMGIAVLIRVYGTNYTITTERVRQRTGYFSRRVSEVEIGDIRNVQVNQGILQRLFGLGNVEVSTAGQSGMEIVFCGITTPQEVADLIRMQRKELAA